ncbi:DNA adenine methylase [Mesonia sp. K7]|uniref:DNA adenine methylase n=1 Tax=Mesonia sp. K7 TaxID=2218606 RepID=UPI000DAA976D|nr:DNA adenine methylase [Mesonia sp. K7]PZD79098.1 modification methylase [Mesonia sp. K7]
MNYIGSKNKLSGWIKNNITQTITTPLSEVVFCDLFAGTGIVGRTFKPEVKQVIANDVELYSYVLLKNYIGNHLPIAKAAFFIEKLNSLSDKKGFIAENYGENGQANRLYFSEENAQKIDACRQTIATWKKKGEISENEYYFLLASLLESADKVANTASVYGAFLKKLKKSAEKPIVIEPANFEITKNEHQVFNQDSNQLIQKIEGDVLYLDPPYNARQYGANYHLLNTIAEYDNFIPKGKTGLRNYYKSAYCQKGKVAEELEELIKNAQFKYIFLSYNNEGLLSVAQIRAIFEKFGKYQLETKKYQRFKADKTNNRNHKASSTEEYLHILEK